MDDPIQELQNILNPGVPLEVAKIFPGAIMLTNLRRNRMGNDFVGQNQEPAEDGGDDQRKIREDEERIEKANEGEDADTSTTTE